MSEAKKNEALLKDLVEVKRQLFEAETKEMKNINKKNLDAIKIYIQRNPSDNVIAFVLDSMTKFFTADANATYAQRGQSFFSSADDLQ